MNPETGARGFPSTRWTLILSAQASPQSRRAALDELIGDYWKPLYFYIRRRGLDPASAQDAVQGFITQLLERDFMTRLNPGRGRLRSYLKTAVRHYLSNLHEKQTAQKRGGDAVKVTLDFDVAESALSSVPESPEAAYEQQWATGIMRRALEQLRAEFESGARKGPFEVIEQFFAFDSAPSYKEVAAAHDMSIPQLKAFLHRARVRYRELVRNLVTDTVYSNEEADGEVSELLQVLGT